MIKENYMYVGIDLHKETHIRRPTQQSSSTATIKSWEKLLSQTDQPIFPSWLLR